MCNRRCKAFHMVKALLFHCRASRRQIGGPVSRTPNLSGVISTPSSTDTMESTYFASMACQRRLNSTRSTWIPAGSVARAGDVVVAVEAIEHLENPLRSSAN